MAHRGCFDVDPSSFCLSIELTLITAPSISPRGLCSDGDYLWCVDNSSDELIRFSEGDGTTIKSFYSPAHDSQGLTFDGTNLWVADISDDKIYKLDLSGTIIDSFDSPGPYPTGLAFDGTYLWNADYSTNTIYKLDLSGTIIDSFDSPGSSPEGLTFDGTNLWVADISDDKIYKWVRQGVTIGSSVSQTFTIISNGGENLEIGNFTITGTETSEFTIENDTCSGQTLTTLKTCTFDVVFSPSSAGKKTASLEISSNDVFSPKIVPLSGTGEKGKAMPWIHLLLLDD